MNASRKSPTAPRPPLVPVPAPPSCHPPHRRLALNPWRPSRSLRDEVAGALPFRVFSVFCGYFFGCALALAAFGSTAADPRLADPQTWLRALSNQWSATSPAPTNPQPSGPSAPQPASSDPGSQPTTLKSQLPSNPQPSRASAPQPASSNTGSQLTTLKSQLPSTYSSFGRNMDALDDKRKLAVGDRITFRVIEDQEDPKALTVTDSGELDIPELGLVTAVGKTCKELASEVKSNLLQTTYYRATVIIGIDLLNKTMSGRRVYLAGEVRRAGPQEIPAGEAWTVSKAILSAGGFTEFADKKRVRLVRSASGSAPGKTLTLSVADVWEKGRTELDLPVEAEDLIYVPGRAVNF